MTEETEQQTVKASPHLLRLAHWVLSATLLLLIFTGFCLHAGAEPAWSVFKAYPEWLPAWRMQLWHLVGSKTGFPNGPAPDCHHGLCGRGIANGADSGGCTAPESVADFTKAVAEALPAA